MKKNKLTLILVLLTGFASAQTFNCMGTYSTLPIVSGEIKPVKSLYNSASATGLPCDSTTFWATDVTGQVLEFHINAGVVTNNGVVISSSPGGLALAVGDNVVPGATFSPTFYTSNTTNNGYYYDGTGWVLMPDTATSLCALYDATASGANLFYFYNNIPDCIEKYDGTHFTLIHTDTLPACVADLAMDDANNIYYFTGTNSSIAQYINVISTTGTFIKQYNFSMNTDNAYGCFFLNGILYVGLGSSNPVHPNTLIPISFAGSTATAGSPISMPALLLTDLASCVQGTPLSVLSLAANDLSFTINPNPVNDYLNFGFDSKEKAMRITITNVEGRIVYHQEFQNLQGKGEFKISASEFVSGCYFIHVTDGRSSAVQKFLKL